MATLHPARLIGAPAGNLQPGDAADLVVFDLFQPAGNAAPRFTVREVIAGGQMLSHK
jgi:cytosine/adenosine deaminase-related metal-dependent hydrolase